MKLIYIQSNINSNIYWKVVIRIKSVPYLLLEGSYLINTYLQVRNYISSFSKKYSVLKYRRLKCYVVVQKKINLDNNDDIKR